MEDRYVRAQLTRRRWSYQEFVRLPDDGNRYEVLDGELHVTPSPAPRHQMVLAMLQHRLTTFVEAHGLGWVIGGPVDLLFGDLDYLVPDLVLVGTDRGAIISDRGIEAAPNVVVEVLSGSTAVRDRGIRLERYTRFGVPECWIVDPAEPRIDAFRAGRRRFSAGPADIFVWDGPGASSPFELPVADLTAHLP